ncbi:MAG: formylglycine-generating enzyme family protein, partial [Planctomycetota bacterium]
GQYRLFDPDHESGFIEERGKDRSRRGALDMSRPDLPVVRITQRRAVEFCDWLSKKSGMKVSLPTDEQWEWAARAGSGGKHYLDAAAAAKGYNIVDEKDRGGKHWNYGRIQKGHDDGRQWVEKAESFTPNAWGLYNVLGNVSEWTDTDYRPLEGVGVTKEAAGKIRYKTVRGGSWNDAAAFATLASRWRHTAYQPVYDVGFRVVARP